MRTSFVRFAALLAGVVLNGSVQSATSAATPVLYSVVNAASYQAGPLAPGEIVALFGDGLGPGTPIVGRPDSAGRFPTSLGTTRVLINGLSAPLLYVSNTQLTAVIPFSLEPGTPVTVAVDYQSITSTPLISRIAAASPAIFTAGQTGKDQVSALNQDGAVNGPASPAAPGSVVALFVSGGGRAQPALADGVTVSTSAAAAAPVTATVAGIAAQVMYAGAAPGLIAGLYQVNVRLPDATPTGNRIFVRLNFAGADSPAGSTIAVANGNTAIPDRLKSIAAATGNNGVTLTWQSPSADALRIHVERTSPTTGDYTEVAAFPAGANSWTDTEVRPALTYTYRVRFETSAGYSEYSDAARADVPAGYVAPPESVAAVALSTSDVLVSWTPSPSLASSIVVERSTGSSFTPIATLGPGASSYRDTDVAAAQSYSYRLRAVAASGTSTPSRSSDVSLPASPPTLPDLAPRLHPTDPHRLVMGGATWTVAGYYPSLGAFTTDQTDYTLYRSVIDALAANGVNFFRIAFTMGQPYGASINPYRRTGPGNAQDGKPKFDLSQFDQSYFDYWRQVVQYARDKGVVLQICMMDGWHASKPVVETDGALVWGLRYDYYYTGNNINGIAVKATSDLSNPANPVFAQQKALIHKIVDTLGDQPNIIWEIANESGALAWELLLADEVTAYEQSQGFYRRLVIPRDLPGHQYVPGQCDNTPETAHAGLVRAFPSNLVLITDNDCISNASPEVIRGKAWAAFTAAAQMDYFDFDSTNPSVLASQDRAQAMTYVGLQRKFVSDYQIELGGMKPLDSDVTNGWALGRSGVEYIVYLPSGGATSVPPLASVSRAVWFNPRDGSSLDAGSGPQFQAPDANDWVLYLLR